MKNTAASSRTGTQPLAHGNARNTANIVTKLMYGATRNSIPSAAAGMRSSLQSSLMPSATGCSQPNRPPTRVGPSRS